VRDGADPFELRADVDLLDREMSLADLVDHLLHRGVCVTGSVTISLAGTEIITLGLQLLLVSSKTFSQRSHAA
jgi:hypothetical protein